MILDLHTHSIKSDDGRAKVANYCQWIAKKELPLDGLVLTEHRQWDDSSDYRDLEDEHGLLILKASEVETDYGHVLLFGVNEDLTHEFDFARVDNPLPEVLDAARRYLGVPYLWGGTNPEKGLDCSGFVQRVYKDLGYDLPRTSHQQAKAGRPVASLEEAVPGDIVYFRSKSSPSGGHIGIWVGDGKLIEAPRRGDVVRYRDLGSRTPAAIRRIVPDPVPAAAAAPGCSSGRNSFARLMVEPARERSVASRRCSASVG